MSQMEYQFKRYREYFKNPHILILDFDTLSGEYWRSINKKTDYFHIFDYWTWDESTVNDTLGIMTGVAEDTPPVGE